MEGSRVAQPPLKSNLVSRSSSKDSSLLEAAGNENIDLGPSQNTSAEHIYRRLEINLVRLKVSGWEAMAWH
jgi:hypothetical protein